MREAKAAVDLGIKTIGEPTAMFLGRDVNFMKRVSEETGLQVVPCTGIYTYDHLPQFFMNRDPDQIAELFIADIEQGIQGTDIKAAFIKCAADEPGVNENIEKIHRAAARASVKTGAPIMAHSRPASNTGPRQVEIFEEEGVDLSKVQIAHSGDTDDLDYIEGLIEKGVWVGLDRYGLDLFLPYDRRQATTKALLERGYADRIFLSADSVATTDWFPPNVIEQLIAAGAANDWTIRIVPEKVLPELREAGHDRGAGADDDGRQRSSLAHRPSAEPRRTLPTAGRLLGEQPAFDLRPMVDHRLGEQVDHAPDRAALRVRGAVDEARDASEGDRPGAHRAGLERHVDRGLEQAPAAEPFGGLAQREHLGVRGGVAAELPLVARLAEHLVAARHHSPDRDVPVLGRPLRELQGAAHHRLVDVHGRHGRNFSGRRCLQPKLAARARPSLGTCHPGTMRKLIATTMLVLATAAIWAAGASAADAPATPRTCRVSSS